MSKTIKLYEDRIGIDFDDVLANFMENWVIFHNREYGTDATVADIKSYNFWELWGYPIETNRERVAAFYRSDLMDCLRPVPGAERATRVLKARGYQLEVITSRPEYTRQATEEWLEKYMPGRFSAIHFVNSYTNEGIKRKKSDICKERGISLHIDDNDHHVSDCAENGIKALLFDLTIPNTVYRGGYPWNKTDSLPDKVIRVHSWDHALKLLR